MCSCWGTGASKRKYLSLLKMSSQRNGFVLSVLSTRCFAFVCLFVTFNDVFEFVVLWVEKQEAERNRKMVVQWFVITDDVTLQKENICASCLSTNHKCIVFACC